VESKEVEISSLMETGFFSKLTTLYTNISDMIQGEEILELMNILLRKVFAKINLSNYSIEAVKKAAGSLLKIFGDQVNDLNPVHSKTVSLLEISQGVSFQLIQ